MADGWREYIYVGRASSGARIFIKPQDTPRGLPAQGNPFEVHDDDVDTVTENIPFMQAREAARYWIIREGWRTLGVDAFGALYMKWAPKRDAILGKEEHAKRSRAEWERFYLALADERAAREYLVGKAKAAFGSEFVDAYLGESGRVGKMMQGGRAG